MASGSHKILDTSQSAAPQFSPGTSLWALGAVLESPWCHPDIFLVAKIWCRSQNSLKKFPSLCWEGFWFAGHGMLAHSSWETIPFPTCKEPGLFSSQKYKELLNSAVWQQLPKANFPG